MLWLLLACGGSPGPNGAGATGLDSAPPSTGLVREVGLSVSPADHVGNGWWLDWSEEPGFDRLVVETAAGERFTWSDPTPPLALLGLPPDVDATAQLAGESIISEELPFHTAAVPEPLTGFELEVADDASEVGRGWVLFNTYRRDPRAAYNVILDGQGRPVWWHASPDVLKAIRARRSADGEAVLWAVTDWELDDDIGQIGRTALDGSEEVSRFAPGLHHDFYEEGDRYHYLSFDVHEQIGFGLNDSFPMVTDILRSVPVDADQPVIDGFGYYDDYPFAPFESCPHAQGLPSFAPAGVEWTHTNSVVPMADGGAYLMARYLDALVRLDADHRFAWQLGGRDATLLPVDPAHEPFHGHLTHAWDDHVLMFDNHSHQDGPSRVMELVVDPEAGTYEAVWIHEEPGGVEVGYLGDARRLPEGNTLIAWSPRGELEEVAPDGTSMWRLDTPLVIGRVEFHDDLPFARSADSDD